MRGMVLLVLGTAACQPTGAEVCEEFWELACECQGEPNSNVGPEDCWTEERREDHCEGASDSESSVDAQQCFNEIFAEDCDYYAAEEACGHAR